MNIVLTNGHCYAIRKQLISNEELVLNVRPASVVSEVTGYGGGTRDVNLEASTQRFGEVKFDPQGTFNLLKFADMHAHYRMVSGTKRFWISTLFRGIM